MVCTRDDLDWLWSAITTAWIRAMNGALHCIETWSEDCINRAWLYLALESRTRALTKILELCNFRQ